MAPVQCCVRGMSKGFPDLSLDKVTEISPREATRGKVDAEQEKWQRNHRALQRAPAASLAHSAAIHSHARSSSALLHNKGRSRTHLFVPVTVGSSYPKIRRPGPGLGSP